MVNLQGFWTTVHLLAAAIASAVVPFLIPGTSLLVAAVVCPLESLIIIPLPVAFSFVKIATSNFSLMLPLHGGCQWKVVDVGDGIRIQT